MAKKNQSYGEAMNELQEIMERIEHEELDVDILLQEVKQATKLIKYCKEKLHTSNEEMQKLLDEIE